MSRLTMFKAHGPVGKVDFENGIIHGVSVISVGEAKGHGMFIDDKMIRQVVKQGKAMGDVGLKSRLGHPDMCNDGIGSELGRFKNFRKDDDRARADLHFLDAAALSPKGDMRDWALTLANEDPDMFATSIVFQMGEPEVFAAGEDDDPDDPEFKFPHARCETLTHCDVVDEGAANDGLFSAVDYSILNAKGFIKKNLDTVYEALLPILNKHKMSDENKSFKEQVASILGVDTNEKIGKLEIALTEANEKIEAYELAQEVVEEHAQETEEVLEEVVEVKDTQIEELTSKFNDLTEKFEKLSKVKLGETVEEVVTEEVVAPAETQTPKEVKHTGIWGRISDKIEKKQARNARIKEQSNN